MNTASRAHGRAPNFEARSDQKNNWQERNNWFFPSNIKSGRVLLHVCLKKKAATESGHEKGLKAGRLDDFVWPVNTAIGRRYRSADNFRQLLQISHFVPSTTPQHYPDYCWPLLTFKTESIAIFLFVFCCSLYNISVFCITCCHPTWRRHVTCLQRVNTDE